ncbi:MAG TPA: hypothetical protein VLL56_00770 [Terriglobia bacterium]|nr:hypothetical protein [Terriglobia bacterium]
MKLPIRLSVLFFIGMLIAGSTALGYYYYFVYSPPLKAAEHFMEAMEKRDEKALRDDVIVSSDIEEGKLREPTDRELRNLLTEHFQRGRILDQRRHEGKTRDLYYLVYREPDGRVYALMAAGFKGRFRIVIPEIPMSRRHRYLWDYTWTN